MLNLKNRRASEKYIFPTLVIVWGMIVVAIVIGVVIIFSADGDFREQEADSLASKILDCIINHGELVEMRGFDVFNKCHVDGGFLGSGTNFYFLVEIKGSGDYVKKLEGGYPDLLMQCQIRNKEEQFAQCSERGSVALSNGEPVKVRVYGASNQVGGLL